MAIERGKEAIGIAYGAAREVLYRRLIKAAIFVGRPGLTETLADKLKLDEEDKMMSIVAATFAAASRRTIIYGDHNGARKYYEAANNFLSSVPKKTPSNHS